MVSLIPNSFKKIWDDWNIRGFILLSLSLQALLILCAPLRKRTSNIWITTLIWSAYLLADWVANFTIGLIASSHGGSTPPSTAQGSLPIDFYLLAFWAPFLLVHLGGPDTIISFSLEDNAFWLRHLLGLLFQVVATLYVFLQSLGPKNKLWFPTLVLFLTGIIKYAERTRALYLGSLDGLKNSMSKEPGINYAEFIKENTDSRYPVRPHRQNANRLVSYDENNIGVVQCAYDFFELSKGLIADLVINSSVEQASLVFFRDTSPEESFHVIAVELNFIYEALFTKLSVAHTKLGYFFRAINFGATSIALVCFYKLDKHGLRLHRCDVVITYTLLCGAMALDSIALFMLIFSDWTVAAVKELLISKDSWQSSCATSILLKYLDLKRPKWYSLNTTSSVWEWTRQILFGRCSESIYTFNLIEYSLKESPKMTPATSVIGHSCRSFYLKTIGLFGLKDLRDKIKYRSSKPLSKDLWNFIYEDLRDRVYLQGYDEAFKKLWAARGDWILQHSNCTELLRYVVEFDYEQSLLLWHIATELCYNTDSNTGVYNARREYSKTLSDYMLYLLFMQPIMMSSVARIGQDALLDTCADAKRFFSENSEPPGGVLAHAEACKRMLWACPSCIPTFHHVPPAYEPILFQACALAIELRTKFEEKKWDLMSLVWVELLSYAAGHCRSYSHAQSLGKGGELVTFVWLAMAHLGIRQ